MPVWLKGLTDFGREYDFELMIGCVAVAVLAGAALFIVVSSVIYLLGISL